MSDSVLPAVVAQFAEESAFLWLLRQIAVCAPHYYLRHLRDLDARVEANLDGLRVCGETGWVSAYEQLAWQQSGESFAATVLALRQDEPGRLEAVLTWLQPTTAPGVISGLAWSPAALAIPAVTRLLIGDELRARVGLRAAALHGWLEPWLAPESEPRADGAQVLAAFLRGAAELGMTRWAAVCARTLADPEPEVRFWAAWSSLLLGDSSAAYALRELATGETLASDRARILAARALPLAESLGWQGELAARPDELRRAIQLAGATGDPSLVEWLIGAMHREDVSRVAGESFSMITGVDLEFADLDRADPPESDSGPTEDPADETTALDVDANLPWPEPALVEAWWGQRRREFARGRRYLAGRPVERRSLVEVLRTGTQRQRAAAALELKLLEPRSRLFEVRADARVQDRWLASL